MLNFLKRLFERTPALTKQMCALGFHWERTKYGWVEACDTCGGNCGQCGTSLGFGMPASIGAIVKNGGWDKNQTLLKLSSIHRRLGDAGLEKFLEAKCDELYKVRFVVDGHEFENAESELMGDGKFPPFYVFDVSGQENINVEFSTRKLAQDVADACNAAVRNSASLLAPVTRDSELTDEDCRHACHQMEHDANQLGMGGFASNYCAALHSLVKAYHQADSGNVRMLRKVFESVFDHFLRRYETVTESAAPDDAHTFEVK